MDEVMLTVHLDGGADIEPLPNGEWAVSNRLARVVLTRLLTERLLAKVSAQAQRTGGAA